MPLRKPAPIPYQDPMVSLPSGGEFRTAQGRNPFGLPTRAWIEFFAGLQKTSIESTVVVVNLPILDQTASIGATDVSGGLVPEGLYLARYYSAVVIAAGTSSSLEFTVDWLEDSLTKSWTDSAMTGNTATTNQSGSHMFYCDKQSPIRISTTYASVGTPVMNYNIHVTLERVGG